MNRILLRLLVLMLFSCATITESLKIALIPEPPIEGVVASYSGFDHGGNTSMAFEDADSFKWPGESAYEHGGWGYFTQEGVEVPYIKRDRDLGQTFKIVSSRPVLLNSIVVRTGFGSNAVRSAMYGQELAVQLFEVTGAAALNENGSDNHVEAFHGFPHDREGDSIQSIRDDYWEGEEYRSIAVFTEGEFPSKTDFGFPSESVEIAPNDPALKGKYLQFSLPANPIITLEPGKQYAFLLMVTRKGNDRGLTLANNYYDSYKEGHGIRRDGNGVFPPMPADPMKDFHDPAITAALESAHFPVDFDARIKIPPGSNGYPDVCTWRDLEFYMIAR